ncbi:MAG: hypothetical protein MSG64_04215 [Pyrinomonadaceae bacterium MAG19_C2-C3]|nr:hypothetical protein [Pyrinomonadaceae bacterium MAG19_C2-C3]
MLTSRHFLSHTRRRLIVVVFSFLFVFLLLTARLGNLPVGAAGGDLDTSFRDPAVNSSVLALALQPDGRVVIGGRFTSVGGQLRERLARLNSDGTLDTSFQNPAVNSTVSALALQPDGKVVIGGAFTTVGGQPRERVARLLMSNDNFANTCTAPPPGMVAWYRAEGNADNSVIDIHGELRNGTTFARGKVGQAFKFDGVDDFVKVNDAISPDRYGKDVKFYRTEATVDFWFMQTGKQNALVALTGNDEQSLRAPEFSILSGNLSWGFSSTGGFQDVPVNLNQWYHAALTFATTPNGDYAVKVYVNGELTESRIVQGGFLPFDVYIGSRNRFGNFFQGLIDEFHVFRRALSEAEIKAIYNADAAGVCLPTNDNFADAQMISNIEGSVTGSNIAATVEVGEDSHSLRGGGGRSVWYRWTAPSTGRVIFDPRDSDFDPLLAVYTGSSFSDLRLVTQNENINQESFPRKFVVFDTIAGQEYRIAVDGYVGTSGIVRLKWLNGLVNIKGKVVNVNGRGVNANATVRATDFFNPVSNPVVFTATTDADGNYSLTVHRGNAYRVTPQSSTAQGNVQFSPKEQQVTPDEDRLGINFLATTPSPAIIGELRNLTLNTQPNPDCTMPGVSVRVGGENIPTRDCCVGKQPNGIITYSCTGLSVFGDYKVIPSSDTSDFRVEGSPTRNEFSVIGITDNLSVNFVASAPTPTTVNADDLTVSESASGTTTAVITVRLSAARSQPVTVNYATADGTARAGSDYIAAQGMLTFPAGTTSQTINMIIRSDRLSEPPETFFINLSNPTNATLERSQIRVTLNSVAFKRRSGNGRFRPR